MKYRLMDKLACPYDKHFPLVLIPLEEEDVERKYEWPSKPFCEEYCSYNKVFIGQVERPEDLPCELCHRREIVTGILYCPECNRWYPIKERIPILLPDELRDRREDADFLESIRGRLREVAPDYADRILGGER